MYQNSSSNSMLYLNDEFCNEEENENEDGANDQSNALVDSQSKNLVLFLSDSEPSINECRGKIVEEGKLDLRKNDPKNNAILKNDIDQTNILKESTKSYNFKFDEKILSLIRKTKRVKRKIEIINSSNGKIVSDIHYQRKKAELRPLKEALTHLSHSLKSVLHQRNLRNYTAKAATAHSEEERRDLDDNLDDKTDCQKVSSNDIFSLDGQIDVKQVKSKSRLDWKSKQLSSIDVDRSSKSCICGKHEISDEMIGCDYCHMRYHPHCIGLKDSCDINDAINKRWFCPRCDRLCEGIFVPLTNRSTRLQKEEITCATLTESNVSSKNSNIMQLFDENKNLSFLKKKKKLKKRLRRSTAQLLKIEQSFNLVSEKNPIDVDWQATKIKGKNNSKEKRILKEKAFKSKRKSISKSDKWQVRKKLHSPAEDIINPDANRISYTNDDVQVIKLSDKKISRQCQIKKLKTKFQSKKNTKNGRNRFICKQNVKIKMPTIVDIINID